MAWKVENANDANFTQLEGSVNKLFQGTGLGLAITKKLAELMNGEITVDSEPNKGSIFYFSAQLDIFDIKEYLNYEMKKEMLNTRIQKRQENTIGRR